MKQISLILTLLMLPVAGFAKRSDGTVDKDTFECIKFFYENGMNKNKQRTFDNSTSTTRVTVLNTSSFNKENISISLVEQENREGMLTVYHNGRKYYLRDRHCNVTRLNEEEWFDQVAKTAAGNEREKGFAGAAIPFAKMSKKEQDEQIELRKKCSTVYNRLFDESLDPLPVKNIPAKNKAETVR